MFDLSLNNYNQNNVITNIVYDRFKLKLFFGLKSIVHVPNISF